MKCPKCSYVGFEPTDRCRHCGYDFSLAAAVDGAAASLTPASRPDPVPFQVLTREREEPAARADLALVDLPLQAPPPDETGAPAPALASDRYSEPPPARTPLAVRRGTERMRSRAASTTRRSRPMLLEPIADAGESGSALESGPACAEVMAPPAARLLSAALDVGLLGAIDAGVLYFTAKIANIPVADVATLPLAPLATFLLGLNVAYLAVFTANGGQTLGKMAAGLRVESTEGRVSFGDAVVRVAVALVGGLAMGAGFLPALWRADRRAVHDQVAHTRVVKVTA